MAILLPVTTCGTKVHS